MKIVLHCTVTPEGFNEASIVSHGSEAAIPQIPNDTRPEKLTHAHIEEIGDRVEHALQLARETLLNELSALRDNVTRRDLATAQQHEQAAAGQGGGEQ